MDPLLPPVIRRRVTIGVVVVTAVVVLAVLATTVFATWSVRRPYPDYSGTVEIPRLVGEVEIIRDEHGIAHIYGDTPEDLLRAQGYVHAQDRFWEMDFRRHVTAGRLAELFGEDLVATDAVVRTMGWRRVAREELPLLEPQTRRYLDAYADGVNAWLNDRAGGGLAFAYTLLGLTGGDTRPEPWTAVDSLAWLKAMAWDLRGNMEDEIGRAVLSAALPPERIEQLYPDNPSASTTPIVSDDELGGITADTMIVPGGEEVALPPSAGVQSEALAALRSVQGAVDALPALVGNGAGIGSNSWVIGGEHTAGGAPLLANDPHLAPSMPSIWYQVGLHCREITPECPLDVAGFSFSGLPGVVIGHNHRIAWGFTNLGPDVTDLYLEKTRGDEYLVGEEWQPMDVREETITVADGDDVTITIRSTRHGPILSDHDDVLEQVGMDAPVELGAPSRNRGYAVALRWTALEPGGTANAIAAMNQATDWDSFRAAAAQFEVPAQNLVYADVDGNIGYQAPGKIPVRAAGSDGRYPAPGWTDDHEWLGYIPFEDLPSVFNPPDGVIVTANQPAAGPSYPHLLTDDFNYGQRADRIAELLGDALASAEPVDADTMTTIQMDTHNALGPILVPYLLDLDIPGGYYGDGLRLLQDWDYGQPADSAPAAYFNAVWKAVLDLTFADELPDGLPIDGSGRWYEVMRHLLADPEDQFWDDAETPRIETRDDILNEAVRIARDDLTRRQGKKPDTWAWGRLHALTLTDQTFGTSDIGLVEWMVNRGPVEVGGGTDIVQATGWDASSDDYTTTWVPSMRMVVDLGDLDASRWIDLTGVSGHPYHPHYGDQTDLWAAGRTLPMRWDEESIRSAGVDITTLVPREPTD